MLHATFGVGHEIVQFGTDGDNQVSVFHQLIGSQRAADPDTARVIRVFTREFAFASLSFGNRDFELV